jgi:hypothetical protein
MSLAARPGNFGIRFHNFLARQYGFRWKREPAEDERELLVNVTPLGMAGGAQANELPFSAKLVRSAQFVFDVVALPAETPLIRLANSRPDRLRFPYSCLMRLPTSRKPVAASAAKQEYKKDDNNYRVHGSRSRPNERAFTILSSTG